MVGGRPREAPKTNEALDRAELRAAYEQGRRDERGLRRRHPLGMTFTFAFAVIGLGLVSLAAAQGSFGRAGVLLDQGLQIAAASAEPVAASANQSLRDAARAARDKVSPPSG